MENPYHDDQGRFTEAGGGGGGSKDQKKQGRQPAKKRAHGHSEGGGGGGGGGGGHHGGHKGGGGGGAVASAGHGEQAKVGSYAGGKGGVPSVKSVPSGGASHKNPPAAKGEKVKAKGGNTPKGGKVAKAPAQPHASKQPASHKNPPASSGQTVKGPATKTTTHGAPVKAAKVSTPKAPAAAKALAPKVTLRTTTSHTTGRKI